MDDNPHMMEEQGEDGEFFSEGKYRQYEMSRMKYYYAVATFDSPETAAVVYDALDGMDIEASGVVLDLRYIDETETFPDAPVSHADRIPPNFKPLTSFKSAALTQSRFRISWDQDDVFRHHSVQDAFTGTTEDDDLAAYLAPPDSDDDEADATTGRSKADEKLRIRRKYAHLLQEIGGLADEPEDGSGSEQAAESASSGSDDDDLNRFSDVEDNAEDDGDGEYDVVGNVESTMDLDADSKAIGLQQEARLKQKMKDGTLAAQAEIKYKQRRKEMKKTKKEMLLREKEDAKALAVAEREQQREKLRAIVGPDGETTQLSGKERRKLHAKKMKERAAQERIDRKQMRAAGRLGVQREAQQQREVQEADTAISAIDSRFSNKLLSDPRFNLDVGQRDRRVAEDIVDLAKTVSKARKAKRERAPDSGDARTSKQAKSDNISGAVDYFLRKPSNKK
ncbi:pre-rRNA processing protein Esf1 [Strigomonas culicis]|nr:pre-rRNA processing protein Esf1 [Strigomonas culicis]|eukprot:EPY22191.1 pre-rRNA processing protein Esf1 [Strigomonas culicis]